MVEELVTYTLHTGPSYQSGNATVLRTLKEVLGDNQHMYPIKPYQRLRDGRGYFVTLNLHNMGSSKWGMVLEDVEKCVIGYS